MELKIVLLKVVNEDNSLLGVTIKREYLSFHSFPCEYKCISSALIYLKFAVICG